MSHNTSGSALFVETKTSFRERNTISFENYNLWPLSILMDHPNLLYQNRRKSLIKTPTKTTTKTKHKTKTTKKMTKITKIYLACKELMGRMGLAS